MVGKPAAVGAAAANRTSRDFSGAEGAAVDYAGISNSFDRHDLDGQDWHGAHPGAWTATSRSSGNEWTNNNWTSVAAYCGYAAAPTTSYNYGANVTCLNGNVVVDGQPAGAAEEFSQRGNYTDEATDHTLPIRGKVDSDTQRVAWTVGDNNTSVMEAGLSNLVAGEAPTLIHKNGKTDRWILVRMPEPK